MAPNIEQAFGGTGSMLSVIEALYSAVNNPDLWDSTLRQIADLLGGESIALFAGAPNAQTPDLLSLSDMDPQVWRQFVQHYAAINPIMQRCEKLLDPEETWFSKSVLSDKELEKTEFYTDFFRPNAMHHSVGMRLQASNLPLANLSCQRPKAAGEFGAQADVILQTLRPHLMRAFTLRMHLGAMEAQKLGLESALEAYDHAVIGIDSFGRVALCSTCAFAVLANNREVYIKNDFLVCKDFTNNASLQKLIRTAINPYGSVVTCNTAPALVSRGSSRHKKRGTNIRSGSMILRSLSDEQGLSITVLPHRSSLSGRSAGLAALVFLSPSVFRVASRAASLIALYGLTPTEARMADLFAEGLEPRELAERMNLTRESARFNMKSILIKTGTHRQLNLLRLIVSIPIARTSHVGDV